MTAVVDSLERPTIGRRLWPSTAAESGFRSVVGQSSVPARIRLATEK